MNRSDKHTLISNFLSLTLVQWANYMLPVVTLPFLFRVLAADRYGLVVFAQAFMQYFVILTDFGFSLSATREISTHRADDKAVGQIFSSVMLIKLALLIVSFVILIALIAAVPRFRDAWSVFIFAFGMVVGQVLFPLWFFQGIERMKYVAFLNLLAKLVFTVLVFAVVRQRDDYLLVPLFNSFGALSMGIIGLALALVKFKVHLTVPSAESLKAHIKAAHHIFAGKIAVSFYTTSNVVILGLFTNDTLVGYFAAGEKIVRAVQGLQIPFTQAAYPYVSKLACESPQAALRFIRKAIGPVAIVTGLISILLFVFAPTIARVGLGAASYQSARVMRILAFLPLIVGMAAVYADLFLLGFGFAKAWARIIMCAGGLGLAGAVVLVGVLRTGYVGLSIDVVFTELLILVLSYLAYHKRKRSLLDPATQPGGSVI
ncbi:MAG: oligosaccharide flippase family protein [Planctomycetota bacterium]